ncbi:ferredoxin [Bradyrhizobium sp. USDA 4473]
MAQPIRSAAISISPSLSMGARRRGPIPWSAKPTLSDIASPRGARRTSAAARNTCGRSRQARGSQLRRPPRCCRLTGLTRHYCLIAGGIGITPLIGTAQALARRNADFTLHYAVSSREQVVYLDVPAPLLHERLIVHPGSEGRRLDFDGLFASLPPDAFTLLCGPIRMLDAARRAWTCAGRALSDLRYETFGSSGSLPTEGFRVRLADRSLEIEIPRDRSLLDVLNEAGCEVISDCRRDECGVCVIDLVEIDGDLDHRDVFFSEQQKHANEKTCACVSRARGTITVDILHHPDGP